MKLLSSYTRINLLATILILLVSSVAYYFLLSITLVNQIDEDLKIEEAEIRNYNSRFGHLPANLSVNDQYIEYTVIKTPLVNKVYSTVDMVDVSKKDSGKFRQLAFGISSSGENYKVIVSKSLEETDSLVRSILLITIGTLLCILVASSLINRIVLKRLWEPFYATLDRVRTFRLGSDKKFELRKTDMDEFDFMNQTIERLINQTQLEYLTLKAFSENASHELQTPLAIIRSKLDILIQEPSIIDKHSDLIQAVYNAVEKLTRLNHSLLLLTKIENNQFEEKAAINIMYKIDEKLSEFQELWQAQGIKVNTLLASASVSMNVILLDILLNNLFSNAAKYNYSGGVIDVKLDYEHLRISNTSRQPRLEANKFKRFYKPSPPTENAVGLGLSIIKQICEVSGFTFDYSFLDGRHVFIVRWRQYY